MNSRNQSLRSLALLSVVALTGCSAGSEAFSAGSSLAATSTTPRATVAVEVFEVKAQVKGEQLIPAVLSTEATATVLAQRDGIVVQLRCQEGARVTKGEELA